MQHVALPMVWDAPQPSNPRLSECPSAPECHPGNVLPGSRAELLGPLWDSGTSVGLILGPLVESLPLLPCTVSFGPVTLHQGE